MNIYTREITVEGKPVDGTIIDFETVGVFQYEYGDTRYYEPQKPYIAGFLSGNNVKQYYVEKIDHVPVFLEFFSKAKLLDTVKAPKYAFNTSFETGVTYCITGKNVLMDGEFQSREREKKGAVVQKLGIDSYGDPFHDDGYKCMLAFYEGHIDECLTHNLSCLLKERDLLFKRGSFPIRELYFHELT